MITAQEALSDMRADALLPKRPQLWPLRDAWIMFRDNDGVAIAIWRQPVLEARE